MTERYELIDAAARAEAHPETWDGVSHETLAGLAPHWNVKIGVQFDPSQRVGEDPPIRALFESRQAIDPGQIRVERFWLLLIGVYPDRLVGRVNNDLVYTAHHGLRVRDVMHIERRHVMDVMAPK